MPDILAKRENYFKIGLPNIERCRKQIKGWWWDCDDFVCAIFQTWNPGVHFFALKGGEIDLKLGIVVKSNDTRGHYKIYILLSSFDTLYSSTYIQLSYYIFNFFSCYLNVAAVTNLDINHLLWCAHLSRTLFYYLEYF